MPRPKRGIRAKELEDYRAKENDRSLAPAFPTRSSQHPVNALAGLPSTTSRSQQTTAPTQLPRSVASTYRAQPFLAGHSTAQASTIEAVAMNSSAPACIRLVFVLGAAERLNAAWASVNLYSTDHFPMLKVAVAEACRIPWDRFNTSHPLRPVVDGFPVTALGSAHNVRIVTNQEIDAQNVVTLDYCIIVEAMDDLFTQDLCLDLGSAARIFQPLAPGVHGGLYSFRGLRPQGVSSFRSDLSTSQRRAMHHGMLRRRPPVYRPLPQSVPSRMGQIQLPHDLMAREMLPPSAAGPVPGHASGMDGVGDMVSNQPVLQAVLNETPNYYLNENRHIEEDEEEEDEEEEDEEEEDEEEEDEEEEQGGGGFYQ